MRRWSIGLAAVAWLAIVGATGLHVARKAPAPGQPALEAAVAGIRFGSEPGWGKGNRPEAAEVAERFARRLRDRLMVALSGASIDERGYAWSGRGIHCQLGPDGTCFLVNTYCDIADSTRDITMELAWRTAREVVGETQGPEARLAIGLRTDARWLAIAAGRGADVAPPAATPEELASFFAPVATTAAAATPGE